MIKDLLLGIKSFSKAHRAIIKYNLWSFIFIPGLINLIFFVGFILFLVYQWDSYDFSFLDIPSCADENGLSNLYCKVYNGFVYWFKNILKFLIVILYLAIYLYLYKYFILIIFSPFYSFLAAKIHQKEKINSGSDIDEIQSFSWKQFAKEIVRGVKMAFKYSFFELFFSGLTLLLLFIPVINLIQPLILLIISAYYYGTNMLDYTLEVNQMNSKVSYRYTINNKSACLGLGIGYRLLSLIPIYGWMFAPAYTVAAGYYCFNDLNRDRLSE